MAKFRKKPVVIEAVRWTGKNHVDIEDFCPIAVYAEKEHINLIIPTMEGPHSASFRDWIIKGIKGEFYPCKPDIFAATYEPAD